MAKVSRMCLTETDTVTLYQRYRHTVHDVHFQRKNVIVALTMRIRKKEPYHCIAKFNYRHE